MTTMQGKILDVIIGRIAAAGLDAVVQADYANTGLLMAQTADFDTRWTLRYEFGRDRCSLYLSGPAVNALGLADNPPEYRWETGYSTDDEARVAYHSLPYTDGPRIRSMLGIVDRLLSQESE